MAENSPADSVVGTVICRTDGALHGGGAPFTGRSASSASGVRTSLARQSCTALAPSVIEPPPMVTIRSARGLAGLFRRGDHRAARRVRRHPVEHADTAIAESAAHLVDLVGLAVQRAADHQEHALRVRRQFGDRLRGGLAEQHLLHLAEHDAAGLRHGVLSRLDRDRV